MARLRLYSTSLGLLRAFRGEPVLCRLDYQFEPGNPAFFFTCSACHRCRRLWCRDHQQLRVGREVQRKQRVFHAQVAEVGLAPLAHKVGKLFLQRLEVADYRAGEL